MSAKWKKKAQPELILDRYKRISSETEDNRIQFSGFEVFDLDPQLNRMIDYGETFNFHTKKTFRDRAIRACIKSKKITKEQYIKELNKEISLYKNKETQDFTLVTSISIDSSIPLTRIKLENTTIRFYKAGLPKKYQERFKHNSQWDSLDKHNSPLPENYSVVTIRVKGKSVEDAAEAALNHLDYVRGVVGYLVNPQNFFSPFGPSGIKPLNRIMLGGMHTLHKTNGKLAIPDSFWFETNYKQIPPYKFKDETKEKIKKNINYILSKIESMPPNDKETLIPALTRYARALDDQDRNVIIQKLWALLESLTAKGENNCDKLVKRCSYLYSESEYVAQILEGIRDYRNQYIHAGLSEEEIDSHCYQLQKVFRTLIGFYIGKANTFESIEEANQFLDFPQKVEDIEEEETKTERRLKLLREAKRFRTGPPKKQ
ncbi:hypothetical protein K7H92_20095 [Pseudomonas stutzeri]|nr:hypothetical protein [Stutzerimonas stutzeri]